MDALLLACAKEGTRAEALEAAAEEANDATDRDAVDPRKGRSRATWSTFQIAAMSKFYESSPFPSAREREALAKAIDLPQRQVQTWFQNRRQRNKDPTSIRPRGVDAQTHEWLSLDMPTYGKPAQPPAAPKPTKPNRMVDYTTPLDVYTTPLATAFFEQARQPPPQEQQPHLEPPP